MASEIESETRKLLIPILFLPIDSWIIESEMIFDSESISRWGLTRKSSFGLVRKKTIYDDMQRYLAEKAKEISIVLGAEFHVIYFDIFWSNRLNMTGGNLFNEQVAGSLVNKKAYMKKNLYSDRKIAREANENCTSYPTLLRTIMGELEELGIYSEKAYKCVKRNDGAYIFETISPRGRRKNIVTIWPNYQGGGDIRIVGIGKYEKRRCFDQSDIGTNMLRADLRMAYSNTQ